jgi:hypothetical protein
MQLAATIAVVVSVLVFAFQAREVARQSRLANEVAGTRAHREILLHWKKLMDVFIQYPELHAYCFDQTPNAPSATESVQLRITAEQHADWLDSAGFAVVEVQRGEGKLGVRSLGQSLVLTQIKCPPASSVDKTPACASVPH